MEMEEQYSKLRSARDVLSATTGKTLTPLLRLIPPDRGSVCSVPATIGRGIAFFFVVEDDEVVFDELMALLLYRSTVYSL